MFASAISQLTNCSSSYLARLLYSPSKSANAEHPGKREDLLPHRSRNSRPIAPTTGLSATIRQDGGQDLADRPSKAPRIEFTGGASSRYASPSVVYLRPSSATNIGWWPTPTISILASLARANNIGDKRARCVICSSHSVRISGHGKPGRA